MYSDMESYLYHVSLLSLITRESRLTSIRAETQGNHVFWQKDNSQGTVSALYGGCASMFMIIAESFHIVTG